MDRHKHVRCNICSKSMRIDHLKRHHQTHKDILSMTDDDAREEIRARHATQIHREMEKGDRR